MRSIVHAALDLPGSEPGVDSARLLDRPGTMEGLRRLARSEGIALRIRGTCMEPDLRDGETVVVRARRIYLPGDVLAVRGAGEIVVHRFLGYLPVGRGWQVWTQADEAARPDSAVRPGDVVGRVERRSGEAVRVTLRQRSRAGRRLLVAVWRGLCRRIQRTTRTHA